MEFYQHRVTVYRNNKQVDHPYCYTELWDTTPQDKTIHLTWDNLNEYYANHGLSLCFNVWNLKRGRLVSFFNARLFDKNTHDIKEWKMPLDLIVKHEYTLRPSVSMDYLLKFPVSKVTQYLQEHGLKIEKGA